MVMNDNEFEAFKSGRIKQLNEIIQILPPRVKQKIQMAKAALNEMKCIDPIVITFAMAIVADESLVELSRDREKLIKGLMEQLI